MRPDRGLAGPNGPEVLVYAGSYGLTPADGPAQLAGQAGSQAAGVTWPVRSGLVPPLADGFITRPETVPGLEAALVPGDAVALVPGQAGAGRPDGPGSSVTNLSNFLDVLLVIFIPWSAVNLADYFLVRRGRYDVASFFTADGAYGRFAWRGLLAYAIGLGAEWPFVSQPDYTGPLVKTLGGADISWLVGWFAAAIVYLLLVALAPGAARHDRPVAATAR